MKRENLSLKKFLAEKEKHQTETWHFHHTNGRKYEFQMPKGSSELQAKQQIVAINQHARDIARYRPHISNSAHLDRLKVTKHHQQIAEDLDAQVQELAEDAAQQFPPTILLRRFAVRAFPNNKQVAIYTDGKTFYAVPSQFSVQ